MSDSERFRCAPFLRFRVGAEAQLAHFPLSGWNRILSAAETEALDAWMAFRTIEEQSRVLCSTVPFFEQEGAYRLLESLREGGALLNYESLLSTARQCEPGGPDEITWLVVPTCSRGSSVIRAVESFAHNRRHLGREAVNFFVTDDSPSSTARERCRGDFRRFSLATGATVFYAGYEERETFARSLAEDKAIPPDVVRLTLFGFSGPKKGPGTNRNCILLQTLGSLVLSADDDVVCDPAIVPGTHPQGCAVFEGHQNPTEYWCFSDRLSALQFAQPVDLDVVTAHKEVLGRNMPSLLGEALRSGARLDLDNLCGHLISSLLSGTGTVRVTFNGLRGDCGLHSDIGITASQNRSTRERVQLFDASNSDILRSRQTVSQVLRKHVSHGDAAGIGACFGLDNRSILPPFLPAFRNQDGLFFNLIGRCYEESYVGHLPFTLVHQPPEDRYYEPDGEAMVRVSDILLGCISMCHPTSFLKGPERRMIALGEHLQYVAALPSNEFKELLHVVCCSHLSGRIQQLEHILTTDGYSPQWWALNLEHRIRAIRQQLNNVEYLRPADLDPEDTSSDSLQSIVKGFGQLLSHWPSIVRRVVSLAEHGVSLGQPVSESVLATTGPTRR